MKIQFLIFLSLTIQTVVSTRTLRATTIILNPFLTSRGRGGGYEGYLVDLMDDLVDKANVDETENLAYQFLEVADGKYGSQDENGRWNGMIGEVINGRADLAVAPMTMTRTRNVAVHFSIPFASVVTVPLVKKPAPNAHFPFGNFTNFLIKQRRNEYSIGYVQHGTTETYLSEHRMPEVQSMYNISKSPTTDSPYVDNYDAAARRVRTSHGKFVFYGEHSTLQTYVNAAPCDLAIDWQGALGTRYYAFVFPRTESGRELMEKFNQLILAAQEDGTLTMLQFRWFLKRSTCQKAEVCMCHEEINGH